MSAYPSQLLAEGLVQALAAAGVRDVVYCPGSRSAPLAYALADAERAGALRVHVRLDERGAAFVAVGLSRAGMLAAVPPDAVPSHAVPPRPVPSAPAAEAPGAIAPAGRTAAVDEGDTPLPGVAHTGAGARAVAVVTTSGGAVAELHAGIAEASHSDLPLVVVSADRPFELRGVGASQTTTQPGIFGPHVRAGWDVPAGTPADRRLGALVTRAVATAIGAPSGEPGPVHLNVGFRDPLVPDPQHRGARVMGAPGPHVMSGAPTPVPWEDVVDPTLRTVVVAGDGADPRAGDWAEAAGIPLLAEPTSGATTSAAWVPHQQGLLAPGGPGDEVEQVVLTGRTTLSRPVSTLLAREDVRVVVQAGNPRWADPAGCAAVVVPALVAPVGPHPDGGWRRRWVLAAAEIDHRVQEMVDGEDTESDRRGGDPEGITMAAAAAAVWDCPPGVLLLGASTTVRAVDLVAGTPGRRDVVSNRGLAGIDGTVATALGLAWGAERPVCAVMGDLTFFHDASSLAMTEGERPADVRVVVLDDHGGSIFAGLEHGRPEYTEDFPHWFATPQSVSVQALAQAYGAAYREVGSPGELRGVLAGPVGGLEVVHVRVRRDPAALAALAQAPGGGDAGAQRR